MANTTRPRYILALLALALGLAMAPGVSALPGTFAEDGFFQVFPQHPTVAGAGIDPASSVTLTIDDDGDLSTGLIFEDTVPVGNRADYDETGALVNLEATGPDEQFRFAFPIGSAFLQPGHYVRVTEVSTGTFKDTFITSLALTLIDVENDTVAGIGDPGRPVTFTTAEDPGVWFETYPDSSGAWFLDLGGGPSSDGSYDIQAGTGGPLVQPENTTPPEQSDHTNLTWYAISPEIIAGPGQAHGSHWSALAGVTFYVDNDNDLSNGSLHVSYQPPNPGVPNDYDTDYEFGVPFPLEPGHVITMTDGVYTKSMTLVPLSISDVNPALDTVSGTSNSNTNVLVEVYAPDTGAPMTRRLVTSDGNGIWTADFATAGQSANYSNSTPYPESTTAALQGRSTVIAAIHDADHDATTANYTVPDPFVMAYPAEDRVHANGGWPVGAVLTMTIDDPSNGPGVDRTVVQVQPPYGIPEDGCCTFFPLAGYDLKAGDYVTITGGGYFAETTVTGLTVTGVNHETDVISGTADTGPLLITIQSTDPWLDHQMTVAGGNWSVDFTGTYDLAPGDHGTTQQNNLSGGTWVDWRVPNPDVGAVIGTGGQSDGAVGQEWSLDGSVTVEVFDGPDSATAASQGTWTGYPGGPDNDWWFGVDFGPLVLQPGWLVRVTGDDSGLTVATVVTDLTVTGWDPSTGTVSGTTSDPSPVSVDLWSPEPAWRNAVMSWDTGANLWRWSADFSQQPIEEQGEWGGPVVLDPDTTGGQAMQHPDPRGGTLVHFGFQGDGGGPGIASFSVEPPFDVWSSGEGWVAGTTVTLTVDDGDPATTDYTDSTTVQEWGPNPWEVGFNFHTDPFEIQPGFVVTVDDGTTVKVLQVVGLSVAFDEASLTVSGQAPFGSRVGVGFGPAWRDVTADPTTGLWEARLGVPPAAGESGDGTLTVFGGNMNGSAQVFDDDGDSTHRGWNAPYIHVSPVDDHLFGDNWGPGPVTVTVNGTPLLPAPEADGGGHLEFNLFDDYGLDVVAGNLVIATQDGWIADSDVVLVEITAVNEANGVVSGSAPDGARVDVVAWTDSGSARRVATATGGTFTVDFSVQGGPDDWEPNIVALGPGSQLRAHVYDDRDYPDHDASYHDLQIAPLVQTRMHVMIFNGPGQPSGVLAMGWPQGSGLYLTVADNTGQLYEEWGSVDEPGPDGAITHHWFSMGDFRIEPGQTVTISGAGIAKTHVVTQLTLDSVDVEMDTVRGTSPTAAEVCVDIWVWPDPPVTLCSGVANGSWAVDFSQLFDIQETTRLGAFEFDDDGDATQVDWWVPSPPYFTVRVDSDSVEGFDWPDGATVILGIGAYSEARTVGPAPWDPDQTYVEFQLQDVDMQPGQIVTLSDGTTTKTHTITDLTVTAADAAADTVSGTAAQNTEVEVQIHGPFGGAFRHEVADASGGWTADFSTAGDEPGEDPHDIGPDTQGQAVQRDADGDSTSVFWWVPNPTFSVDPYEDQVWGNGWPEGATVTLTIDDPANGPGVDHAESRAVLSAPWNPQETLLGFWLKGFFDVKPGDIVTLTDGTSTKTHTVTNLAVTEVDPTSDTVSGTAPAGAEVHVQGGNQTGWAQRRAVACDNVSYPCNGDPDGTWVAHFAIPGTEDWEQETLSIGPGTGGGAQEFDDDGDSTQTNWGVPEPFQQPDMRLSPMFDLADGEAVTVTGSGWPANASITLAQCSGGVFGLPGGPSLDACDPATTVNVTAGASGRFTVTLSVRAQLSTSEFGPVDCTEGLGTCVVLAGTPGFADLSAVPMGFGLPSPGPVSTNPGDLLISDTGGVLWTYDILTGELTDYRLPINGNFDIQYSGPDRIVIADHQSAEIYEFDLGTGEFTLVTDHPALSRPIGLAVDLSSDTYYIADNERGVLAYDVQTNTMRVVIGPLEGAPDGIALEPTGNILFTNGSGRLYRVSPAGTSLEVIAEVDPYRLNGLVVTAEGQVIVASYGPDAVLSIDPDTGTYSVLYEGPPLRDPEDVAIALNGDIYVSDTDFQHEYPDHVPALYRISANPGTLEALHVGSPLGDIVDILVTPGVVFTDDLSTFIVQPGTVAGVTVQIANTGLQPHTVVELSVISDSETPAAGFVTTTPTTIGPGATVPVTLSIDATGTPEGTYIGLLRLASDGIPGEDFANLEIVVRAESLPDLTTTTPTGTITIIPATAPLPPDPSEAFTISTTVFNIGNADADAFTVNFFEGTTLLGSESFAGLGAGDNVPTSLAVPVGLAEGFHVIHVEIVPPAGGELSLLNNAEATFLQVGNPPPVEARIALRASASVSCGGGTVYVSGQAQYEIGSGSTRFTFPVQGGKVTATIIETGNGFSGAHTQTSGFFLQSLGAPDPGTYTVRVEVTDFTLATVVEIPLEVPAVPRPCPTPSPPGPGGPPTPDLRLTSGDILFLAPDCETVLEADPNLGDVICIRAQIHYDGTNPLFNQAVTFTAHFPAEGRLAAAQLGSVLTDFSGGETVDVAVLWAPAAYGAHIIQVAVHPSVGQYTGNDAATRAICVGEPGTTCNAGSSGGGFFDELGGYLTTPNGNVQITIPPGALSGDTGMSVTGSDRTGFELTTNLGQAIGVFAVDIQPSGLTFNLPVTIVFSWDDADDDGFVDDLHIKEGNLLISQDNVALTARCRADPGCDTAANTFTVTVTSLSEFVVANMGPSVGPIVGPLDPLMLGTTVSVSANFTDPSVQDTHTATWDWGDGTVSPGVIAEDNGLGSVSGSHVYPSPGVYAVVLTVTDSGGDADTREFGYVVVYDPNGRKIIGKGEVEDGDAELEFGFDIGFHKQTGEPKGKFKFEFEFEDQFEDQDGQEEQEDSGLEFEATSFDYLLIFGDWAQARGSGILEDGRIVEFKLTIYDSTTSGGEGLIRIKVWEQGDPTAVVFDTQPGESDYAMPSTSLTEGKIKIKVK